MENKPQHIPQLAIITSIIVTLLMSSAIHADDIFITTKLPNPVKNGINQSYTILSQNENSIKIFPTSKNYTRNWWAINKYKRLDVTRYCYLPESTDDITYLVIDCYVQNNSKRSLSVTGLSINVTRSYLDSIPYLFCVTADTERNKLWLYNNSYVNFGQIKFLYSIIPPNETFLGNYEKIMYIDYFDEKKAIDFSRDLSLMGVDTRAISIFYSNKKSDEISSKEVSKYLGPFQLENSYGVLSADANLWGKLSFANGYTLHIKAKIPILTSPECGGGNFIDDYYHVKLRAQGTNYRLRYPYTTIIQSGGLEKIRLIIGCDKSSKHDFTISVENDNGCIIRSKPINVLYAKPKYADFQQFE